MRPVLMSVFLSLLVVACGGDAPAPAGGGTGGEPGSGGAGEIKPLDISAAGRKPEKSDTPAVSTNPADPEATLFADVDRMLGSVDAEQRLEAADKLRGAKDRVRAGPILLKLLKDEDSDVREYSAEALGHIEYRLAAEGLRNAIQKDGDPSVRKQALTSLVTITGPAALPDLIGRLAGDDEPNVRAAAAMHLGNAKDPKAADALIKVISGDDYDYNEHVRLAAVSSLKKLGAKKAVDAVMEALEDANVLVRTEAATTLGVLGDRKAVRALIRLIDPEENPDENSKLLEHAVKSLTSLTGQKIPFSLDDDLEEQAASIEAWVEWWKANESNYD